MIKKNNREFYESIRHTAFFVTIQNVISSSLNLVDVIMLGSLGVINGPGLATQFFYIFMLAIFGFANGGQIYLSQFYGDDDMHNFHRAIGVLMLVGLLIAILFFIPSYFCSKFIMSLYSQDADVIRMGAGYLKLVAFNAPLLMILSVLTSASRASGDSKLPMVLNTMALFINTGLNYVLIYGNFGMPKLSYIGAAYATIISCLVAVITYIVVIVIRKDVIYAGFKEYFDFSFAFLKKICVSASPVMLNEFLWAAGFSLYAMAYSLYNKDAYTSYLIYMMINNLMYSTAIGLAIANSVVLGNLLGAGQIEKAKDYERKFTVFQTKIAIISAVVLVAISSVIPELFNYSDSIKLDAKYLLIVGAVFMPIKFYTMLHLMGTLRSGGDTKYAVMIDFLTMYLVGVPMAFISLNVFHMPLWLAQIMITLEEVLKAIWCFYRIKTGKWANNLTIDKVFNKSE